MAGLVQVLQHSNRRAFLAHGGLGLGATALWNLLTQAAFADDSHQGHSLQKKPGPLKGILDKPHHPPKAKRIIYLFMSGGPSQLDLFDYKPLLNEKNGQDLPESVRQGQRLTGMSAHQAHWPLAGSIFKFAQHGQSRAWVSELMPYTAKMVDEL